MAGEPTDVPSSDRDAASDDDLIVAGTDPSVPTVIAADEFEQAKKESAAYRWHYYARRSPGTQTPAVYMGEIDGPNVSRVCEYRWMWRAKLGAAVRNLVAFGRLT